MDQRWYALRFPAGASCYIIDSQLLEGFCHGSQPHDAAFQSFIIVTNQHYFDKGKLCTVTTQNLKDAIADITTLQGGLCCAVLGATGSLGVTGSLFTYHCCC